jgi:hypothetical protein
MTTRIQRVLRHSDMQLTFHFDTRDMRVTSHFGTREMGATSHSFHSKKEVQRTDFLQPAVTSSLRVKVDSVHNCLITKEFEVMSSWRLFHSIH